jgi:hypothetical protein
MRRGVGKEQCKGIWIVTVKGDSMMGNGTLRTRHQLHTSQFVTRDVL